MQFLSLIGLVVLLGLAWAMSYHPRRVRLRTVVWGLGLQFVFALIILKQDKWSFIGMVVLAALLVVYIMQEEQKKRLAGARGIVVVLLGAAVVGGLAGLLVPQVLGWLIIVVGIVAAIGGRVGIPQPVRRVCGALVVVFGTAWLIVNGIHGQTIFAAFSQKAADFLALSDYGARFLFGNLADGRYYFVGQDTRLAGLRFSIRLQGPADDHLLWRIHGRALLPRHHADRHREPRAVHEMDGRNQRRRNPVVHRQCLCRPDRGSVAHQTVPRVT